MLKYLAVPPIVILGTAASALTEQTPTTLGTAVAVVGVVATLSWYFGGKNRDVRAMENDMLDLKNDMREIKKTVIDIQKNCLMRSNACIQTQRIHTPGD